MAKPAPNFHRLDCTNRHIAVLIGAMLQARQAVERRSWNTQPQEPVDENWWMDVLADPRGRVRKQTSGYSRTTNQRAYYTLADEQRPTKSGSFA